MAKHDYNALAKTNVWGLNANDIKIIEESGDLYEPGNHWTFMKINTGKVKNEYEAVYDGVYMHVFGSLEDLMARTNEKAFYEYSDKESADAQQETFVDVNGNIREYGKGGKIKEKMYRVNLYWKDNPDHIIEGYLIKLGEEDEDSDEDENIFYYIQSEKELKSLMDKDNPGEFVITQYAEQKFEKGGVFLLSGSGMKKVKNKINILPNRVYYMGASSSPEAAVVIKVDKDWITYRRYPYYKDLKIEYWVGQGLIAEGSQTWLKNYANYDYDWVVERRKSLQDLFAGGTGIETNPDDLKRVEVIIGVTGARNNFDAWHEFEKMYPHSVSSGSNDGKTLTLYESYGLAKKMMDELEGNKNFRVDKISEEPIAGETGAVLYERSGTKYEKGGIPNNYQGKTTEQVWNEWTPKQREHFIDDHYMCEKNFKSRRTADLQLVSYGESLMKYVRMKWEKIPDMPLKWSLDSALYSHIMTGQYGKGGIIKTVLDFLNEKVNF